MEQKIEELNQKYSKLMSEQDNYNTRFTKNYQNFYQYAIAAGEEDFQKGVQATKRLKKLIDTLSESSKFTNQIIANEAFQSIQILITTLLQSTRWQDNNAGIWIIILYLESNYNFLDIKPLSQIFKHRLTYYLEESEEMFQENTSKLLTLLMNENDIFFKQDYQEIQEMLIQSMNQSLQLCENFQDYFQVIKNYLNSNNHQLIGLQNLKVVFQEKYISKTQLSPLLQILKELKSKTNLHIFNDLLLKCCLVNQKQTQLSAFKLLLEEDATDQNDYIEVLRYSLLHNNIKIVELGTSLAKHVIKNNECNQLQEIKLLIYLNQALENPIKEISQDLIINVFKIQKEDTSILRDNFILILNICSMQARNEIEVFRVYSWINLAKAIKQKINQEDSSILQQLIQLCQTEQNRNDEKKSCFYFLYFVEQLIYKRQEQDKSEYFLLAKIISKFVGKFQHQDIENYLIKIFKILEITDEQLLQLQNENNQSTIEVQQAWKKLRQDIQLSRQNNQNKK